MTISNNFEIITDRLLLKVISLDYKNDIFKEFSSEVAKFLFPQPTGDIKDTLDFINNSRTNTLKGNELQLVALDKKNKEFLGCVGLHNIDTKQPEFGLWFKKSSWGLGYGRESMLALKDWVKSNLDYDYIYYPVFKDNIASRKIAESLGGKLIGEFVKKNQLGIEHDEVEYRIYN